MESKTLYKLYIALAKVQAAFPAGDYHLDEKQNTALNELGEVTFELKKHDSGFREMCEKESWDHTLWQLDNLKEKGLISDDEMKAEIEHLKSLKEKKDS